MKQIFATPLCIIALMGGMMMFTSCVKDNKLDANVQKQYSWQIDNQTANAIQATFYYNKDSVKVLTPTKYQSYPATSGKIASKKTATFCSVYLVKGVNDSKAAQVASYMWTCCDSVKFVNASSKKAIATYKKKGASATDAFYGKSNWKESSATKGDVSDGDEDTQLIATNTKVPVVIYTLTIK
jgi:hypothetical protein